MHGYLSSKESFIYQINYFSKLFKVVAFDFEGMKKPLPYPYCLDDYKNSVNRLIEALSLEKFDVLAHSFGARVLFKMLPNEKIDKIVLTGAAGLKPKRSLSYHLKVCKYKLLKRLLKAEKLKKYGSSDYLSLDETNRLSFIKIVNEHLDEKVKKITNKALIVHGELDKEISLKNAKKMARYIKNSSLYIIKGAGHYAFLDSPAEFNIIVKEFLLL